jgi:hypothetical protein
VNARFDADEKTVGFIFKTNVAPEHGLAAKGYIDSPIERGSQIKFDMK